MTLRIQILLVIGTLLFFLTLLRLIRKGKMTNEMAIFWIVLSLILVLLAVFPQIAIACGELIGIMSTINAIYLVLIFLILCFLFYIFIKITALEKKVDDMIQRYAIDKKIDEDKKS